MAGDLEMVDLIQYSERKVTHYFQNLLDRDEQLADRIVTNMVWTFDVDPAKAGTADGVSYALTVRKLRIDPGLSGRDAITSLVAEDGGEIFSKPLTWDSDGLPSYDPGSDFNRYCEAFCRSYARFNKEQPFASWGFERSSDFARNLWIPQNL
jgi:hypothetical protein